MAVMPIEEMSKICLDTLQLSMTTIIISVLKGHGCAHSFPVSCFQVGFGM